MIFFYRFLIMPAILFLAVTVGLFSPKIRTGLKERLNLRKTRRKLGARPIWIHASSGEFEYAKSVIRETKARYPQIPILVTYFSPSYKKQIENFAGVDQAEPLPLDLPGPVHDFLKFYRPRVALFARTDLWPEILTQTKEAGIASLLFACTRPPLEGWRKVSSLAYRTLYSMLNEIQCVSPVDEELLRQVTNTHVAIAGDTRYDQVAFRLKQAKDFSRLILPTTMPRLIAGSTWPEDENILLPAVAPLLKAQKLQFILVPHEPTPGHIKNLQNSLSALGVESELFSQTKVWAGTKPLIIDQVGILADLYAHADAAFIGGSFKAKVHSVMEALGAGLPVLVGPHYHNNREATEFQRVNVWNDSEAGEMSAVTVVHSSDSLRLALERLIAISPGDRKQIKQSLHSEFVQHEGASQKVLSWLTSALQKSQ